MTEVVIALGLGLLGGLAYFAALHASLRMSDWRLVAVGTVVRLLAAVALFRLAVAWGALPLLAALAGFLVARWLMVRRLGVTS
jgi:hypothetical protein